MRILKVNSHASEHRLCRCSAIESLQAVFRWETSICCKMAFPSSSAWKCSFYGRKLIEEAAFSRSSNRQSRSCGLLMKGLRPFHPFLGFIDSLKHENIGSKFSCWMYSQKPEYPKNESDGSGQIRSAFRHQLRIAGCTEK